MSTISQKCTVTVLQEILVRLDCLDDRAEGTDIMRQTATEMLQEELAIYWTETGRDSEVCFDSETELCKYLPGGEHCKVN